MFAQKKANFHLSDAKKKREIGFAIFEKFLQWNLDLTNLYITYPSAWPF